MKRKEKQKKLYLIFHGRFPSEKAAALFAAKSAISFTEAGFSVTLLVSRRFHAVKKDPYEYYKIPHSVNILYLPTLDLSFVVPFKQVGFLASFVIFSISSFLYLLFRAPKDSIIYSNESLPLWLASFVFPNTFYEVHDFPEHKLSFYRSLLRSMRWILATNQWKMEELVRLEPAVKGKIIVEPNAVDINAFNGGKAMGKVREELGLPQDKKLAVYTGHLYGWKGVNTLAEAARLLPLDITVVFVGGTEKDIARFKEQYGSIENIIIAGYRPHEEMPLWQNAADVLVVPNTAKEAISSHYTSPMKLFEYMASARPIVASDLLSIRQMLSEKNAVLVKPDDPNALAEGIKKALDQASGAVNLSVQALQDIKRHSWTARAGRIGDFVACSMVD